MKLPAGAARNPKFVVRAILGVLLLANLLAAYAVFNPLGGSAEELDAQIAVMRQQIQQRQSQVERLRTLARRVEQARAGTGQFLSTYFMNRRTASSTIVAELSKAAKDAGMKPKEHSFVFDPIEGSEDLSMMTINGHYEGSYSDLLEFVNRLDQSPRFLILDSMTAAPQQGSGTLNVSVRLNTFVREDE
ncbi:MAG: type 4a pilus biogenesis protein PilO [Acidobacteria bacterium]|nr:type 4a pilus biogenesis protein PilO [Acidobacteriota bacterium]MBI3279311.1 type 4a pilus biogenesis protein PilO [Acidobacteriota bacterium]